MEKLLKNVNKDFRGFIEYIIKKKNISDDILLKINEHVSFNVNDALIPNIFVYLVENIDNFEDLFKDHKSKIYNFEYIKDCWRIDKTKEEFKFIDITKKTSKGEKDIQNYKYTIELDESSKELANRYKMMASVLWARTNWKFQANGYKRRLTKYSLLTLGIKFKYTVSINSFVVKLDDENLKGVVIPKELLSFRCNYRFQAKRLSAVMTKKLKKFLILNAPSYSNVSITYNITTEGE